MSRDDEEARPAPLGSRGVFLLSQLGFHVAERCAQVLGPLDLHPSHFGVLSNISRTGGSTQQELADLLGIHRNVMVGIVDALEGRGLVRREARPGDRRVHDIQLTERAHAVLVEAAAVLDDLEREVLAPLGEHERDQLVGTLHRLADQAGLPDEVHPGIRRRQDADLPSAR